MRINKIKNDFEIMNLVRKNINYEIKTIFNNQQHKYIFKY